MLAEFRKKRSRLQAYTWFGLPVVIIGGWFYPVIGLLLLGCMLGALGVALYKGRAWCDWMCPRGSFYDLFLSKWSLNRRIPGVVKTKGFRIGVLAALFAILGTQIYFAWGDIDGMGMAMVRVLTVTTTIGIVLGLTYHQRMWCHVCPMGTLSNFMSSGKYPLTIDEGCADCRLCAKACPMQLTPYSFKTSGQMTDNDCIKCSTCVAVCPKKILHFEEKPLKKAA